MGFGFKKLEACVISLLKSWVLVKKCRYNKKFIVVMVFIVLYFIIFIVFDSCYTVSFCFS